MKILLVVPEFPALSETFIVNKFLGLIEAGHDVHVLCSDSPAEAWTRFPRLAIRPDARRRVHVAWPTRPRWLAAALAPVAAARCALRAPRATWRYLVDGARRLRGELPKRFYLDAAAIPIAPDVIHFEFGSAAVGRTYLAELLGSRIVVSFRGFDLNFVGLEDDGYYAEVWRAADAVHCLGQDLWARAQARGCPPDKRHALISPAVELDRLAAVRRAPPVAAGTPERPLRLLSVARLHWKKGHEFTLEAVRLLCDRGVEAELRIVGGGDYLRAVAFCRHQLGLEDRVELLGPRGHEEVLAQLEWADVFVHSAVSEGFCNAVIEAQAAGVPVVTSDADGLAENVADGVTGFVVPRRDAPAMAERLARLAADPALRDRLGAAGRERARARFRLDDQIRAFDRLYRELEA